MKIISRQSTSIDLDGIIEDLSRDLQVESWDLGCIFISLFSGESTAEIVSAVKHRISCKNFIGCSSAGVITSQSEIENQPATSLILMKFDHVTVRPFYILNSEITSMTARESWYQFLDVYPNEKPKFLLFPDPFSIDINLLLGSFNNAYPLCPVIGGLASGASQPGENTLILNDQTYNEGCVGMSLQGDVRVETVVSQGCRPIGEHYVVTKAEGNVIYELGGRPFYKVLEEVLNKANERDRNLAQEAIFVGVVMDEYKQDFKTGDFLIRILIGLDQASGAGAVADYIKVGQTVQFHVRDAVSATFELNELMGVQTQRHVEDKPSGALLFSCNGRGRGLFGVQDHDLNILRQFVGNIPVSGFFCAGEIGPVGGKNFVHGFTSSIALFYSSQTPQPTK